MNKCRVVALALKKKKKKMPFSVYRLVQRNRKKQKESTRSAALKRKRQKAQSATKSIVKPSGNHAEDNTPDNEDYHDEFCEHKRGNMNILCSIFSYFTSTIIVTFYTAVAYFIAMYFVIKQGYFDTVHTENGLKFYAEKAHPRLKELLPTLDMPLNTIVNIGYLNVGLIVVAHAQKLLMSKKFSNSDAAMFFIFGWSSFLYGHVQFWRIILQTQQRSVMDQWITLPIFAWTICWTCHVYHGWSFLRNVTIIAISTASYCLTWYDRHGFEIVLGLHIVCALFYASTLYWNTTSRKAGRDFWLAICMCAGFVVLKLLDLELPKYHPVFTTVSGHFLSKICDFLQVYYVSKFFMHVTLAANKLKTKGAKSKTE